MKYTTHSERETHALAKELAHRLKKGDVLLLQGDLGAGKTAFVRGLHEGVGAKTPLSSPTFALIHVYEGGRLPLYHADLYRLEDPIQVEETGLFDLLPDGIGAVEWPQVAQEYFPKESIVVTMEHGEDEDERYISIEGVDGF